MLAYSALERFKKPISERLIMTVISDVGIILVSIRQGLGYTGRELAEYLCPRWDRQCSTAQGWISKFEAIGGPAFPLDSETQMVRIPDYLAALNPLEHHRRQILEGIRTVVPDFVLRDSDVEAYTAFGNGADPDLYHRRTRALEVGNPEVMSKMERILVEYEGVAHR